MNLALYAVYAIVALLVVSTLVESIVYVRDLYKLKELFKERKGE
jgi:hypothetical protein